MTRAGVAAVDRKPQSLLHLADVFRYNVGGSRAWRNW